MSSKNLNKELLILFPGNQAYLTTPKLYTQLTGSHSLALVLSQCIFWSNKSRNLEGYFFKSYEEWIEELNIPERTLRRRFDKLEYMGFINTKIKTVNGLTKKHIFVNMEFIINSISELLDVQPQESIGQNGRSRSDKVADPTIIYTDEYRQTTTEKSVSDSFFTEQQQQDLLELKLPSDERTSEEFIENCQHHIEIQNNEMNSFQRFYGLKKILTALYQTKEKFNALGFKERPSQKLKIKAQTERLRDLRERAQQEQWENNKCSQKSNLKVMSKPSAGFSEMLAQLKNGK